jgi:hypothetical protein
MRTILAASREFYRPRIRPNDARGSQFSAGLGGILAAAILLSGCAGAPVVTAAPSSCATLLPPEWKQGVAGAELPDGNTVGDWIAFGDAQTGRLDQANERTKAAIGIVERCEERDAAAIKRVTRGWFGRLFG